MHTDKMGWKEKYERRKGKLLNDPQICAENRRLFAEFYTWEEHRLKRLNGLRDLDERSYKTLYGYTIRLMNVNGWFGNKPWAEITRDDIQRVYDALEDGRIRNKRGLPFEDLSGYYNKIMKFKPFRLAGKDGLARDVIEYTRRDKKDVRFLTEETFRRLVAVLPRPEHRLLLWLAWDIGENIGTLLTLTPEDFLLQIDPTSGEGEYIIQLREEKLKRSRTPRSELTLYPETAQLIDHVLRATRRGDPLFRFGYATAAKMLRIAVRKTAATTLPGGHAVRWKDLRSGMACHLLRMGWRTEEVNARLGHTPRSDALDAYINFMALSRSQPKQRLHQAATLATQQIAPRPPSSQRRAPQPESHVCMCPHCLDVRRLDSMHGEPSPEWPPRDSSPSSGETLHPQRTDQLRRHKY